MAYQGSGAHEHSGFEEPRLQDVPASEVCPWMMRAGVDCELDMMKF